MQVRPTSDRLRETLKGESIRDLPELAEKAVWDTMARSVNTSLSTIIVLAAILFARIEGIHFFVMALTVGLVSQLDDAALAWRAAKNHSRFSNRAPLTAVFFTAVGLVGGSAFDPNSKAAGEGQLLTEETQVQALQQFRQLVFKCAVVWLVLALVFAVAGWLPSSKV